MKANKEVLHLGRKQVCPSNTKKIETVLTTENVLIEFAIIALSDSFCSPKHA